MSYLNDEIERCFTYHPPNEEQIKKIQSIRKALKEIAYILEDNCPPSRESSIALSKLEEVMMWATAAIVR